MAKIIATVLPEDDDKTLDEVFKEADGIRLTLNKNPIASYPERLLTHPGVVYDVGQKLRLFAPDDESRFIGTRSELEIGLKPQLGSFSFNQPLAASDFRPRDRFTIRDDMAFGEVADILDDAIVVRFLWRKNTRVNLRRAGINFQRSTYKRFCLSGSDKEVIREAWRRRVFMLAFSNVEGPEDILLSCADVRGSGPQYIVPKIETELGVTNLKEIISVREVSNIPIAVMIARGDLFNEAGPIKFPFLEDRTISICRSEGAPIIAATGLLTSLMTSIVPSRAEVTALKTLLDKGVDYLMLSDETAPNVSSRGAAIGFLKEFMGEWQKSQC